MTIQNLDRVLAWDRPRVKRQGGLANFLCGAADRSSSCSGGACGYGQRRRPPTRKPCTEHLCWDPCTLFEAPGGKEVLNDARGAKCHVCSEWLPQKPLFGKPQDRYVRPDPLFRQYWVCTTCVAERDWALPSTPTSAAGREVCGANSRPHTPAEEVRGPRRSSSLPGLPILANTVEGPRPKPKPRPPRLLDDEVTTGLSSSLPSPVGSLAQAGAALVNDVASEGRRSGAGSPIGSASSCQVCAKSLIGAVVMDPVENRVCNACEARCELNAVSLRDWPLKSVWPARGANLSTSWELIDLSASK